MRTMKFEEWNGFNHGTWEREINVRDFIQKNYEPYDGDDEFLAGPTQATKDLWEQVMDLSKKEREAGGVLDMDTKIISTITSHGPGYLNKEKETIVGFQTDKPFKRALQPNGGIRMAMKACSENGYEVLLTRANLLQDFIDHYRYRYHTMLDTQSILDAAEILSWDIFQADGSNDVKIMDWNHVEPISLSKALSQGGAYA